MKANHLGVFRIGGLMTNWREASVMFEWTSAGVCKYKPAGVWGEKV